MRSQIRAPDSPNPVSMSCRVTNRVGGSIVSIFLINEPRASGKQIRLVRLMAANEATKRAGSKLPRGLVCQAPALARVANPIVGK